MKILAIDTATEACSAALEVDDICIQRHEIAPRKHAELILPMVDSLMEEAGIKINSLDAMAFGCGPGAFTGIRIATGIIQGLAYPYDIPVIPISTLAALAQQFAIDYDYVAPAIDARMNEIYWGLYKKNKNNLMELLKKEQVCLPNNISSPTKGEWFGVGSGWIYSKKIKPNLKCNFIGFNEKSYPKAEDIIQLAKYQYRKGKFLSADKISPVYLRNNIVNKKNQ